MRYFQRNLVNFVNEMGITDLLFTCCSYSAVGPNADNLEAIRTSGVTAAPIAPDDKTEESSSQEESSSSEEIINEPNDLPAEDAQEPSYDGGSGEDAGGEYYEEGY